MGNTTNHLTYKFEKKKLEKKTLTNLQFKLLIDFTN